MLPQATADHYRAQQRLVAATLGLTRREWASVSMSDIDGTWAKVAPRVNLLTASAQLGAARSGAGYIGDSLAEMGYSGSPLGIVDPRAFAGFASDGRPLGSLLEGAKAHAKVTQSLEAGGKWLDMAVHTQIADAGRQAAGVSIAAHPRVAWARMVNPPCCARCAVLAGKVFRFNQGFKRHPRCDCVHVPTTLGDIPAHLTQEPSLDQIRGLSAGERRALDDGADLSRVVNARRGSSGMTTTSLAKRGSVRLTPDGILAQAKTREEALDLLRRNGYITPTARPVSIATKAPSAPVPPSRPVLDLSAIRAAKTPDDVGRALQDVIGSRGKVSGFDHPTIGRDKAVKVAEQIARLSDKYPQVRFDVVIDEVKNKMVMAHANYKPGADGTADSFKLIMSRSKMTARSKSEDMLKASADANHWRVSPETDTDAMTYVVTHEFGHLVDYTTGNYARAKAGTDAVYARQSMRELAEAEGLVEPEPYFVWASPKADPVKVQQFHDYQAFIESQLSKYARTSSAEGIAEAFADVEINGEHASASNKLTVSRLRKLLKEMGRGETH